MSFNLDPLEYPENYLWVRLNDHSQTIIGQERLKELLDGSLPQDETERMLRGSTNWLHIYLEHVIGTEVIVIPSGGPLPEWDSDWLESWS